MDTPKKFNWECPACGSTYRTSRTKMFEEEERCPVCKFDGVRKWPVKARGRPEKGKKTYSIRLSPEAHKLAVARARQNGKAISDVVEDCIRQVLGRSSEAFALARLRKWDGLLVADKRTFTGEEGEVFNEMYYLFSQQTELEDAVKHDPQVGMLHAKLKAVAKSTGMNFPVCDSYTEVFCGLLSSRAGNASLWAYTLWRMAVKKGGTVDLNDWTMAFSAGVPTRQGLASAWEHQRISVEGQSELADFTELPSLWRA